MVFTVPTLSALADDEQATVNRLHLQLSKRQSSYLLHDAYYNAEMQIASLGISIPPELVRLRTIIGWPRLVVDALDERLDVVGFRLSDTTDASTDLWDIWQANKLDAESQLGHLDALIFGSAFITVGSPDEKGDPPIICVESPLDVASDWDARTRTTKAAWREYAERSRPDERWGTLYLPDQTISLQMVDGNWKVTDRDEHDLGAVPVVRMSNRARTADRHGRSEITPEVVSLTDAACRTFLGMEVAKEFFAVPQRWALGVSESDFQDAEGNDKTPWQSIIGRFFAMEGNDKDSGQPASVGQFPSNDPASFTKVLDAYAKVMASITGLPADYLGITTTIPSSADAIRMGTDRLVTRAKRKQRSFEGAWEETMRLAMMFDSAAELPSEAESMETVWRNPEIPTPVATTQSIHLQVQAGILSANSDVALEHLGYSPVEIKRIKAERALDQGAQELAELADSLQAKQARTDLSVATDIKGPTPNPNPNPLLNPPAPTPPNGG